VRSRQDARGLLVLSEKGRIDGSVKVYDAVINGTIAGDVEVEHFLELQPGARVTGNISYRKLRMECGASVDGRLQCLGGQPAEQATTGNVVSLPRVQAAEG
jgi:cytoskeletal protein CcmA (bactofilin family)